MIAANELRIGNWYVNQWGEYLQVDADLFGSDNLESYPIPIPLTPEILEKCGFEKDNSSKYGGYLIGIGEGEKIRIVNDESIGWHYPLNGYRRPITNYLHQLQNLYFALTGEELNYMP
jgi:hypothetical protein